MGSKCGQIINSISQIVGNRVDSQDSCSAGPGSTKKGCALFLVSSKLFYLYLHLFYLFHFRGTAVNVTSTGLLTI